MYGIISLYRSIAVAFTKDNRMNSCCIIRGFEYRNDPLYTGYHPRLQGSTSRNVGFLYRQN